MDVITMEATAYKELIRKIEKIADYVFKKGIYNRLLLNIL